MKLQQVIDAWNKRADQNNQWDDLGGDEMVEFTLQYLEECSRPALNDLADSVYDPVGSAITVDKAIEFLRVLLATRG